MPEVCFEPAKTRSKFEFFEMHTCLCPSTQLFLGHKLMKLDAASLLLHCIDRYFCPDCWNEFFQQCFKFYIEFFSYSIFEETFAIVFQNWFVQKWVTFGVLCWDAACFDDFVSAWIEMFVKCYIFCLIWRHKIFSMASLRVNPVCCSNVLVIFSRKFLQDRLISFSIAVQILFLSFCVS